jgi:NAD dependent epimerase/dehydratase
MSKKVLVTGADGFIGSHLTEYLLVCGYRVKALAFYNSFNSWGWLDQIPVHKDLEIVSGDIRDSYFVNKVMKDVDVVFHLAALIAIPYSYLAPESYIDTNIKGTLNICQAARELGNLRVLQTSTSEVYGTAKYTPIYEKHPKQSQSPYSASKIGGDAIAMSFYNSFGLPITIVRPFNTYGPRQSARAIIPTIITQIASGISGISLGDLTPTRDLNFVIDICRGFVAICESEKTIGREINIASNSEISVGSIFNTIKTLMGKEVSVIVDKNRYRPSNSEVFQLVGDNTLIKELTGWSPQYSFNDGLRITIEWFTKKENLNKYKSGMYNI